MGGIDITKVNFNNYDSLSSLIEDNGGGGNDYGIIANDNIFFIQDKTFFIDKNLIIQSTIPGVRHSLFFDIRSNLIITNKSQVLIKYYKLEFNENSKIIIDDGNLILDNSNLNMYNSITNIIKINNDSQLTIEQYSFISYYSSDNKQVIITQAYKDNLESQISKLNEKIKQLENKQQDDKDDDKSDDKKDEDNEDIDLNNLKEKINLLENNLSSIDTKIQKLILLSLINNKNI